MLRYTGIQPTNFTNEDGAEIVLHPGDEIQHMNHPIINALKASGLLVEIDKQESKKNKK